MSNSGSPKILPSYQVCSLWLYSVVTFELWLHGHLLIVTHAGSLGVGPWVVLSVASVTLSVCLSVRARSLK